MPQEESSKALKENVAGCLVQIMTYGRGRRTQLASGEESIPWFQTKTQHQPAIGEWGAAEARAQQGSAGR
jgi:hypothetical protein